VVPHLLVTNDFPPKHGGIQSYLWELWRRLPADDVTVLTTPYPGAEAWDAAQPFRVVRDPARVLLPTGALARRINELAAEVGAELVVLDPGVPLGKLAHRLTLPYAVVLHGAEVTVPARAPIARSVLGRVLRGATAVIAAGGYPAREGERAAGQQLPVTIVPPGVDADRFRPLDEAGRIAVRRRFGLPDREPLVVAVSRLVPRKGMDVAIEAIARVAADQPVTLAIGGAGRDRRRLERLASRRGAPVHFLGRVPDDELPGLYASADVFTMLCRNRWRGLEQEGFGIVFLEAAAAGVPQVAGDSGGAAEAVVDGRTGLVVADPTDVAAAATALTHLLGAAALRADMAEAGRQRAETEFSYDQLARTLAGALDAAVAST
jgi:phosphatidylinositol alpha-1,6-mannosyltransferase